VYQGPKSASFSCLGFLVEAEPRLENRQGQKALFGRGAHNVFRVRLGKNFENHKLIVNFGCQIRYTGSIRTGGPK
jgi:hypothetical protein